MRSDCFERHVYRSYAKKNAIRYIYTHSFRQFPPEDEHAHSWRSLDSVIVHTVPARMSASLLLERVLLVIYLGAPLMSQKVHGCHGKITRFQIIVSLGATKIRMTQIMNPILDSPQNTPHPQIPKYTIALTASAGTLLFFFLNLSVNTF